jgi:uncharacterized protein YceK
MTRRLAALLALGLAACAPTTARPACRWASPSRADRRPDRQGAGGGALARAQLQLRGPALDLRAQQGPQAERRAIDDLVKLRDAEGNEHAALLFDVSAGELVSSKGQTFQARMAPGSNYMLVVEVLSKDATPTLLASGCSNVIAQVGGGQNAPVAVKALARPSRKPATWSSRSRERRARLSRG